TLFRSGVSRACRTAAPDLRRARALGRELDGHASERWVHRQVAAGAGRGGAPAVVVGGRAARRRSARGAVRAPDTETGVRVHRGRARATGPAQCCVHRAVPRAARVRARHGPGVAARAAARRGLAVTFENSLCGLVVLSSLVPGLVIFTLSERQSRLRTTLNITAALVKLQLVSAMFWGVYRNRG